VVGASVGVGVGGTVVGADKTTSGVVVAVVVKVVVSVEASPTRPTDVSHCPDTAPTRDTGLSVEFLRKHSVKTNEKAMQSTCASHRAAQSAAPVDG
jgi:hypothetical protein